MQSEAKLGRPLPAVLRRPLVPDNRDNLRRPTSTAIDEAQRGRPCMRRASVRPGRRLAQAPCIRRGLRVRPAEHVGFREAGRTRNARPPRPA